MNSIYNIKKYDAANPEIGCRLCRHHYENEGYEVCLHHGAFCKGYEEGHFCTHHGSFCVDCSTGIKDNDLGETIIEFNLCPICFVDNEIAEDEKRENEIAEDENSGGSDGEDYSTNTGINAGGY